MARKDSEESKKENEKRTEVGRPLADALFFDLGDEAGWFHGKNSAKVTVIFRRGPLIVGLPVLELARKTVVTAQSADHRRDRRQWVPMFIDVRRAGDGRGMNQPVCAGRLAVRGRPPGNVRRPQQARFSTFSRRHARPTEAGDATVT
jgi:hypothetical protein